MSKFHKSLFILLLLTTAACKSSLNGQYLIYKTETVPTYGLVSGIDYDASCKMLNLFKGKKYDLQFTARYATLREENSDEDLVLDNVSSNESPEYELIYTKNREKVKLTLYDKSESDSKDVLMFVAIYEQVTDSIGQTIDGGHGLIKCFLTKPTN